jgi:hypothetical protein
MPQKFGFSLMFAHPLNVSVIRSPRSAVVKILTKVPRQTREKEAGDGGGGATGRSHAAAHGPTEFGKSWRRSRAIESAVVIGSERRGCMVWIIPAAFASCVVRRVISGILFE